MISELCANVHFRRGSAEAHCALRDLFDEADRNASFKLGPADRS
jgi:hypothetical protein